MIHHLRLFKRTPPNGLAAFSGNVAEREGQSDVRVWSIEPPVPLNVRIYRCDKLFVLDPIEEMLEHKEIYGLVVIDRRDATIAFLKGKSIIPISKTHSEVPGKFKAGGQSSQRFHRLIEGAAKAHYKKVAEKMKEQFLGKPELKGILVGGPGPTKYDFIEEGQLATELKNKIIAVKDLTYTDEFGLHELVDRSEDVLAKEGIMEEKKIMEKFFQMLATQPGKASYGAEEVMKNLEMGVVDVLLLSEDLDDNTIQRYEDEGKKTNVDIRLISTETREGVQLRDMGKIAAILRYEVSH
jgi:peptide chain release factor subunit 1